MNQGCEVAPVIALVGAPVGTAMAVVLGSEMTRRVIAEAENIIWAGICGCGLREEYLTLDQEPYPPSCYECAVNAHKDIFLREVSSGDALTVLTEQAALEIAFRLIAVELEVEVLANRRRDLVIRFATT